ncbi:MAG: DUF2461 domain-containing protein [Deltaproteobacteria bacterium]|nr:DUF2461 domain-containing protein [Deltaproteobacteria bacterium]
MAWFDDDIYEFMADLADNNERAWFNENKKRYESSVKAPALAFITDFGPALAEISEHVTAIPKAQGGSLFRIYRDTRFSKDKTPYKTHVGLHFKHALAKSVHAPGFYMHLEPGGSFFGGGIWRPESAAVKQIRASIDTHRDDWASVKSDIAAAGLEFAGDSLKRIPRGYDKEHPLAEDLKRKDFIVTTELAEDVVLGDDLVNHLATLCKGAAPLHRFLCEAIGVPF